MDGLDRVTDQMLRQMVIADSIFGFHVQQAAEKSLKAWLVFLVDDFPFTHDLALLLDLLGDHADVSAYEELIQYTPYAVQLRYDVFDADLPIDRQDALADSEALWTSVRDLVATPEVPPQSVVPKQPPEETRCQHGSD